MREILVIPLPYLAGPGRLRACWPKRVQEMGTREFAESCAADAG